MDSQLSTDIRSVSNGTTGNEAKRGNTVQPLMTGNSDTEMALLAMRKGADGNSPSANSLNASVHKRLIDGWMEFYNQNYEYLKLSVKLAFVALYFVYFGFAMACSFGDEGSMRLLIITAITVAGLLYKHTKRLLMSKKTITDRVGNWTKRLEKWVGMRKRQLMMYVWKNMSKLCKLGGNNAS